MSASFSPKDSIDKSAWVAEACLWTNWIYMGDLVAEDVSHLTLIDANRFCHLVCDSVSTQHAAAKHARDFLKLLQRHDHLSDIFREEELVSPDSARRSSVNVLKVRRCCCFTSARRVEPQDFNSISRTPAPECNQWQGLGNGEITTFILLVDIANHKFFLRPSSSFCCLPAGLLQGKFLPKCFSAVHPHLYLSTCFGGKKAQTLMSFSIQWKPHETQEAGLVSCFSRSYQSNQLGKVRTSGDSKTQEAVRWMTTLLIERKNVPKSPRARGPAWFLTFDPWPHEVPHVVRA